MNITVTALNVATLLVSLGLLAHSYLERECIKDFAKKAVRKHKDPLARVLALAGFIYYNLSGKARTDPYFIPIPLFNNLGGTPGSILKKGGCCSGLTRLTIVALKTLGIDAGSITLCLPSGQAQHCLLEVTLPTQNVLIDPTYGLYFVDELGRGMGLTKLQSGARPSFARLPYSIQTSYPENKYYEFDYRKTKTANWTKSRLRRILYRILVCATNGTIDQIKQPAFLEWPQFVLAAFGVAVCILLNSALIIIA
ncbi:MAG: hypothetical protein JNN16_18655 [Nitrospira sp.]|nr:hypothetical protein [Nitrospira sp.]